jgi:signal transduction histidine kinase
MKRPRGLRQRLLITVVVALAGALVVIVATFNFVLWNRLSAAADDAAYARADAELAALKFVDGRLAETRLPDRVPLSGQAWVFAGRTALVQPRVGETLDQAVRRFALGGGHRAFRSLPRLDARLYLTPIIVERRASGLRVRQHLARKAGQHLADSRVGVVVVALSMRPFQATRDLAMLGSTLLAATLLAAVAGLTYWTLGAALRPVDRMTAAAESWAVDRSPPSFGQGRPYDEITRLAQTLDRLLGRLSASLRREQRFSAELSHELRTPLARLTSEIEVALRRRRSPEEYRTTLQSLLEDTHYLTRVVDTLVLTAPGGEACTHGRADTAVVVRDVVSACSRLAAERGVTVTVADTTEPCWVGIEPDVAARILQPLLQNACRFARSEISVELGTDARAVAVAVNDDGPGVCASEAHAIFQPGVSGSAATRCGDGARGAGLGLPLARRLAEAVGGTVDVEPGPAGRFVTRLPPG